MKSVRIAAVLAVLSLVVFSNGCEKPQKEDPQPPPPVAEKPPAYPRDAIPDNTAPPTPPPAVSSEPPPTERPITTIAPEPSGGHKTTTPKPKEKYASGKKAGGKTYVIQKGDTLQEISQKFYGTTTKWRKIADANKGAIKNPDKLVVGTKIQIP